MKEVIGKSISELQKMLSNKELSAVELAQSHLKHIEQTDKDIQAFNNVTPKLALAQAKAIDEALAKGEKLGPLAGIPLAIKDNICVKDYPTTCSSKILESFVPPYDATVTQRLHNAGAVFVGKTNMDEFAMGSSTENSAFRLTRNPWNLKTVPGGSSGGSTAAVAAGSCVVSLGSDTGGSIRQPASFCGVVGMKPTYGTVSRYGLVAFASSLDQIGPLGRCVEDVALVLETICGHDAKDSTSLPNDAPKLVSGLNGDIKGLRIGLIKELIGEGIDTEVAQATLAAAKRYTDLGAIVEEVSLPNLKHALPVYYIIATAEASANLARFDGVKYGYRNKEAGDLLSMYLSTRQEGFGAEVKRRIMLGTYALSSGYYDAYYKKAQQVRRLIAQDFEKIFAQYDLVICPTSPSVAFEFGSKTDDPLTMYLSDIATIPANLAGIPGISLPCGFDKTGMPIGLQLLGPALSDGVLLKAAHAFEQTTDFHKRQPPMLGAYAASH